MNDPPSSDAAKASDRLQSHLAWKRAYFVAPPPPPPRPRLHRLNHQERRFSGVATLFAKAKAIMKTECPVEERVEPVTAQCSAPPPTPQERWVAQMREERERWNPYVDVQIRSDPKRTVIMSNLSPQSLESDVRGFADQFGRVVSCRVVQDRKGRSRGYAFVEFGLTAEARRAVSCSRQRRLGGRLLTIDHERGRGGGDFLPKRLARAAEIAGTADGPDPLVTATSETAGRKRGREEEITSCTDGADMDAFIDAIFGV